MVFHDTVFMENTRVIIEIPGSRPVVFAFVYFVDVGQHEAAVCGVTE